VNDRLEDIIVTQFDTLTTAFEERPVPTLRVAAYTVALERVLAAADGAGIWP
jgi:glutamate dehydrogenase (NAD(P)+)